MTDVRGIQHDIGLRRAGERADRRDGGLHHRRPIARFKLRVLEDDRHFFPRYDCVLLYRLDLPARNLAAWAAMQRLIGAIDEKRSMIRANALVIIDKKPQGEAARALLAAISGTRLFEARSAAHGPQAGDPREDPDAPAAGGRLAARRGAGRNPARYPLRLDPRHSRPSSSPAPGSCRRSRPSRCSPSWFPSWAASAPSRPWSRSSSTACSPSSGTPTSASPASPRTSPRRPTPSASPPRACFRVNLPLASPSIMAGLKTSAVINVGTATLAALVGGGGLGRADPAGDGHPEQQPDLAGAVPAAVLALPVQGLFDLLDRVVIPKGLRLRAAGE